MNSYGISFLAVLPAADQQWLLDNCAQRTLKPGERLLHENQPCRSLFIVVYGLLNVVVGTTKGEREINRLGPGELIGEISFVENSTPSASVVASERSAVLEMSWEQLQNRIASDSGFAARLYHSINLTLSQRLRRQSYKVGWMQSFINDSLFSDQFSDSNIESQAWNELDSLIGQFLNNLYASIEEALFSDDIEEVALLLPENLQRLDDMLHAVQALLGEQSELPYMRDELGLTLQHRFSLHLQLTENGQRWLKKPRGYSGDYLTIAQIQNNRYGGNEPLGIALDRYLLQLPFARLVRNRLQLFTSVFANWLKSAPTGRPLRITLLCSGAANEMAHALNSLNVERELIITMGDIDEEALNYGIQQLREAGFTSPIDALHLDLVRLALGNELQLPDGQDLLINMNLLEQFNNDIACRVLNQAYRQLREGGLLLMGGAHTNDYSQAFMQHVFDWRIVHRNSEDLRQLLAMTSFGSDSLNLTFDHEQLGYIGSFQR